MPEVKFSMNLEIKQNHNNNEVEFLGVITVNHEDNSQDVYSAPHHTFDDAKYYTLDKMKDIVVQLERF